MAIFVENQRQFTLELGTFRVLDVVHPFRDGLVGVLQRVADEGAVEEQAAEYGVALAYVTNQH